MLKLRDTLAMVYASALEQCAPERLINRAFSVGPSLTMASLLPHLEGRGFARAPKPTTVDWPQGQIFLLAAGKSAGRVATGLRRVLRQRLSDTLVIAPPHAAAPGRRARGVTVMRGAHPIPDASSEAAGSAALEFVSRVRKQDLLIVAMSGGASSLMVAPAEGLTLDDLTRANAALLRSGTPIEVINAVRGRLSRIKNGHLARRCRGRLVTLVLSDVGGGPELVGSGPTLATDHEVTTSSWDLKQVLDKHVLAQLVRNRPPRRRRHPVVLLAEPAHLVAAASRLLERQGFDVVHAADVAESPTVNQRATTLARAARSLAPNQAWVECCEPVIRVPKRAGVGGRNGHLVLKLAKHLSGKRDLAAVIAGSDGIDGTSLIAGAAIDGSSWETRANKGRGEDALRSFNSGGFLSTQPTHITVIAPGPTGVNLRDLHIVARR